VAVTRSVMPSASWTSAIDIPAARSSSAKPCHSTAPSASAITWSSLVARSAASASVGSRPSTSVSLSSVRSSGSRASSGFAADGASATARAEGGTGSVTVAGVTAGASSVTAPGASAVTAPGVSADAACACPPPPGSAAVGSCTSDARMSSGSPLTGLSLRTALRATAIASSCGHTPVKM